MESLEKKIQYLKTNINGMIKEEITPIYAFLIISEPTDEQVLEVNNCILTKFKSSGLVNIKNNAWKVVNTLTNKNNNLKPTLIK